VIVTCYVFLWVEDPSDTNSQVLNLRFAWASSITSHFRPHHFEEYQLKYPDVIPAISDSFYADDIISGGRTVDEVFKIYEVVRQVMFDGGFNLRKWNSNLPELLSK